MDAHVTAVQINATAAECRNVQMALYGAGNDVADGRYQEAAESLFDEIERLRGLVRSVENLHAFVHSHARRQDPTS